MKTRGALLLAACLLAACSVRRRATDPLPVTAAPTEAAPILVDQSTVPVSVVLSAPEPEPVPAAEPAAVPARAAAPAVPEVKAAAAPPVASARPRVWGRVAITTAIVSPSQLIGPEVPYSEDYRPLPVFPEKLVFDMSWGLLSVGEATLGVDKIVMFNGRPAYHLVSEARSNAFCDTFYVVRDLNESWLDARTLTSLGYSKKVREGRFFRDEWVLYDRDAGTFVNRRVNKDGTFNVRVGTIPARVQDILSSIYYVRAQPLEDKAELKVHVNTPDNWPLTIKVTKRESLKVPAGRFKAVVVEPMMIREGIFVQKGKRLRLWFSDDPRRRLLMFKAEVFFGNVTAALREML
ncbi:MAG: DUF3108 domain-containing protein [Elusimicrobia bacterium]|nr:DUF3108 domain-containing protein [Elusimicrobiota bacterium]